MAEKVAPVALGSNKEPLGKEAVSVACQHTDKLPSGSSVIKSVADSEAHLKNENVAGIHAGKRPKYVAHPNEAV